MKYSDRILNTVKLLVPEKVLSDIGCDHGYMSILAIQNGLFERAYACDVNAGPLSRADKNIRSSNLEEQIKTVLSNGFQNVPFDTDCAVICGMGGLLIKKILFDGRDHFDALKQMVLGPHSEEFELRSYIYHETPFEIVRETCVLDAGKHYVLMDVRKKSDSFQMPCERYLRYGFPEAQTDPQGYREYLSYLISKNEEAVEKCREGNGERSVLRAKELSTEIKEIQSILSQLKR